MKIKCSRCKSIIDVSAKSDTVICSNCGAKLRITKKPPIKSKKKSKSTRIAVLLSAAVVFILIVVCIVVNATGKTPGENTANEAMTKIDGKNIDAELETLLSKNDMNGAFDLLFDTGNREKLRDLEIETLSKANIGDEIMFGKLEQDGKTKNTEWIEWTVIEKDENSVLLLSKFGLFAKPFNESGAASSWQDSSARQFLNNDFINLAFTEEEAELILSTENKNPDNSVYKTKGSSSTNDKVFLLSIEEAEKLSADIMKCAPTTAALRSGAWIGNGYSYWWLRNVGQTNLNFADVRNNGVINSAGSESSLESSLLRPAIRISIK